MRIATEEDVPLLLELGAKFHAEKQAKYGFVEEDCRTFFEAMLAHGVIFMEGRGFIAGTVMGQPSNQSYLTAHELFWWSEDGHGADLLSAFESWAAERGCHEISLSHPEGERAVGRYLRRAGYEPGTRVLRKCAEQQ